jgi:hypothetical protein
MFACLLKAAQALACNSERSVSAIAPFSAAKSKNSSTPTMSEAILSGILV